MKELENIIKAYEAIDFAERKAALATVVRVQGSSYRRAGARMIMTDQWWLLGRRCPPQSKENYYQWQARSSAL
jgi:xanthine dehydrogenase accessory factor